MLDSDLKSKINKLWDKFWSGGISNPIQAIEQMSYLLFMKPLEDDEQIKEQNAQFTGDLYESYIPKLQKLSMVRVDKLLC